MTRPILSSTIDRPRFSKEQAVDIARSHSGLDVTASELPSHGDQNFRLVDRKGDQYVLKIAARTTGRDRLEFENSLLPVAAAALDPVGCPASVLDDHGSAVADLDDGFLARILTWVDGIPLATATPHTSEVFRELGVCLGSISRAFKNINEVGVWQSQEWNLVHGATTVAAFSQDLRNPDRRKLIDYFAGRWDASAAEKLPQQVVFNDANDYNVLVTRAGYNLQISGLIDFGDATMSCRVADPVIASAYGMLEKPDPVAAACAVVSGFTSKTPLSEVEIASFFDLVCMRLCTSAVVSASCVDAEPDNPYLSISADPVWRLLERLRELDSRLCHYRLRHAAGFEPSPNARYVAGWLAKNRSAAICDYDLKADPLTVFDLSVSSTDPVVMTDEPQASRAIFNRIASDGAVAGIGRYDEPRVVYTAERYKMKTWTGMQNRTVHLGIDVFLLPGHRIYAPYDGVVHAVFDNASNQSYGPTVILRHETDDWISFHTLYGHLARGALSVVEPGQAVAAGDLIGMVGEVSENGGWTPHLHFQVITDMLGYANDFPGVALAEQRSVWLSLSPDPNLILGIRDTRMAMQRAKKNDVHFVRQRYVGPSLSLSYDEPLHIVRGRGARLFDSDGRAYLDCVNNVCHVGHCNPEVVAAAAGQMRTLNTNTRYLHRHLVAYAERLAATLPDPLQVCFFVNSGSEANDLALRMAQTHTGRTSTLVIEAAYHGNLSSLIATSPYKFDGAGGSGKPTGTYVTALPDTYRGLHRGADAASRYASDVKHQLQTASEDRLPVAAFLFESIIGCGGQLDPPPGYLKKACAFARDAGALCIADEVQIGFGRVGTSFWGFERSGVVPDIVTMGKPIGNGHPMGAVVTTPEIAQSFANGMEYFNTFGGNPVSCAVGLAVLDVLENEGLQEHAHEVGSYLIERLRRLIDQHSVVGDVRGSGLFLGIELVTDRISREPAAVIARYVINRARTNGVLLSLDGPDENVIKIKPPLVFSIEDADLLVATISEALAEY